MDAVSTTITMKRLQNELKLLTREPMEYIETYPDENNMFLWYFLVRGPEKSDYEGGCYIGKIMLSAGYPKTPVDFMMLTPNGRFAINSKICLTNSGYHADQWTPMWNMRVILLAFLSIMLADDTTGISHIKESPYERKQKASNSLNYNINNYKNILLGFKRFIDTSNDTIRLRTSDEIKLIDNKDDKKKKKDKNNENKEENKVASKEDAKEDKKEDVKEEKKEDNIKEEKEEELTESNNKGNVGQINNDESIKEKIIKPKKKLIKKEENLEEKDDNKEKPKKKVVKKKDENKENEEKLIKPKKKVAKKDLVEEINNENEEKSKKKVVKKVVKESENNEEIKVKGKKNVETEKPIKKVVKKKIEKAKND